MKVVDIDYELSIKLGDPVNVGGEEGAGEVFSAEERLSYIRRAYSKLSRNLRILMRDYQPDFNNQLKVVGVPLSGGDIFQIPDDLDYIKIHEVSVSGKHKKTSGGNLIPYNVMAIPIDSDKYLSVATGVNTILTPNTTDPKIYYTIINNWFYFLPMPSALTLTLVHMRLLFLPDLEKLDFDDDIPITREYLDLLIELAASMGMADIARTDKVNLFRNSVYTDLEILAQYSALQKQQEGVKE